MASQTLTTNSVVFLDYTDERKLDVYISSNLPTSQIYNVNTGAYSPDWGRNPLTLSADVYLDASNVTNDKKMEFEWYKQLETNELQLVGSGSTLTISDNQMKYDEVTGGVVYVNYICKAKYNDNEDNSPKAQTQITFARVDTGVNGSSGSSAPEVKAEYSEDGITNWTPTLNTAIHKYIHLSYDGGKTWPSVFKIAGDDGTSVKILGSYDDVSQLPTSYDGEIGDGYIVEGNLHIWSGSQWQNVGSIQGPKGDQGDSYYLFIRYADNASGSGMSTSPTGKKYIGFYRSSVNQAPTDSNTATWNWAKFAGEDAKSVVLSASSQVFKADKTSIITPATITVTAQATNTTINSWAYSVDGGRTFSSTTPTGVVRNGNVFTLTGSSITTNSIVIRVSDGIYSDVLTVYKVYDGADGSPGDEGKPASIAFLTNENIVFAANADGQVTGTTVYCNVVAYNGTTKVTPTIGTITGMPAGMTLGEITTVANEQVIPITIANNATLGSVQNINGALSIPITSPVSTTLKLNWGKVNSGSAGRGIQTVTEYYALSTSKTTVPTTWSTEMQTVSETHQYLWNYEQITYTDNTNTSTIPVIIGVYSADGRGINSIVNHYLATNIASGVTKSTAGWTTTEQFITSDKKYLWNYETINYTDNTSEETNPIIIGVYGDKGDTGTRGLQGIQGVQGLQGVQGVKGDDGLTSYFHIKYSSVANPTTASQMSETPNTYIGTYVDFTEADSTDPSKYTWTQFRGSQGVKGDQGIPGTNGANGQTSYLHIAYANNATGTSGFDVSDSTNKLYIGQYTDFAQADSTDPTKYSWTKIKGEDGKSIASITEYYAVSSSNTTAPTTWQTTVPATTTTNRYLWNYEVIAYTTGNPTETAKRVIGTHGATGSTGSAGRGITAITNYYLATASASGVTHSTTGWTTTVQNVTATNKYLWNYEEVTYTTGDPTKTTPSIIGVYGDKGDAGTPASLVDITPTAYYFKSITGKDGTFTPEYIYIYPRFQNVSYSNWQYSINGGTTWVNASGANGLTIGTYSSAPNSLRIARTSTLYTDNITSISFRCNSNNASVYDTISIAKIYDVVDLQIGGKNLLTNSGYMKTLDGWKNYAAATAIQGLALESNDIYGSVLTATGVAETSRIRVGNYIPYLEKNNRSLTFSMVFSASVDPTTVSMGGKYSESNTTGEYGQFYGGTVKRVDLGNGFTYMECPVNLTYTEATRSFFVYIYPRVQTIKIVWCKLEDGNVATDWTPSPEDVDASIEKVDTRVTNVSAEVKTTTDAITSRVSETEKSIGTINGNISSLSTRVSTAEQKITSDAIVSTVRQSTDYTNDLGKKVNSTEVISTINQTAGSVTINANKIGLLGATNIPDLTADKIKGGTLTLGGSNVTTQNGQLLVKNASNADMVKLNKDGVIVKSGHLAVAEDFTNSRYNWEDDSWTTTTNTSQLDIGDDYLRMGYYTPSGYTNMMRLLNTGLYFQGVAQGVGSWGSFIGHTDNMDFVIQDTTRGNITFKGYGDAELAHLNGEGLHLNGLISGSITSGNAKQFTNVFTKNFPAVQTGYIAIRLGTITRAANSMITIKGHITSYHNSTNFEASCYFYNASSAFFGTVATMSNPDVLREVYFAEGVSDGCVYLILGASNSNWSYPTVAVDTLTVGFSGSTAYEWESGWTADVYANLNNFKTVTPCSRGGMKTTLWSGAVNNGKTITLAENLRNFKFLTCIIGDSTTPYGIVLTSLLDDEIAELHFFAFTTNPYADSQAFGAKFTINNQTSLTLVACGTKENSTLYCRKIVGWR